jgi:hypothetical protein
VFSISATSTAITVEVVAQVPLGLCGVQYSLYRVVRALYPPLNGHDLFYQGFGIPVAAPMSAIIIQPSACILRIANYKSRIENQGVFLNS